jgi:hypothetical protein
MLFYKLLQQLKDITNIGLNVKPSERYHKNPITKCNIEAF